MAALGAARPGLARLAVLLTALVLTASSALAQAPAAPDSTRPPPAKSAADTEIETQRRELESLKSQLDERRKQGQALKGREKNVLVQLRESEKNLQLTVRYLNALEKRRRVVASSLGDATTELVRTAAQLDVDRRRLAWRLREIYKRGRSADLEYLLSARSFGDLVTRTYYLARIAQEDRGQVLLTQARRGQVQDTKTRLESRKRELDRLKEETDRERVSLNLIRTERRSLLKKIRSDSKTNEQAAQELERASRRIQTLIGELEKRRLAGGRGAPGQEPLLYGDFGKNRGRLPWPVSGRVARGFGSQVNPRFGTKTFNSGVDIAATFGTPIAAVAKGRVEYVNWLEGYGKCAIINHGGGFYTLYANASEILVTVGKDVAAGETIGKVGDTGSTMGTALHFEIRKGREALNPLDWFR
ncbi:MAG TPA: peptidoglycan DD-metalloendopeptidase family protein [Candidatus Eisenbacteria bacterium]|jgi:septal ring factor EnvC (AmiA/AmiB activator)|nr:peptidoglycan DD-metalloendopeptidase family protein [Candidatus Eisenbacteria bacterium]